MAHVPHTFTAAHLICRNNTTILLQRRFQTGFNDGKYSLPAGHVEENESFNQTLTREIKEEIGIEVNEKNASLVHIMHRKAANGREFVDAFYLCDSWDKVPTILEPEKCDDLSWFTIDALPENTLPYIKQALENISQGKFYSEFGWE